MFWNDGWGKDSDLSNNFSLLANIHAFQEGFRYSSTEKEEDLFGVQQPLWHYKSPVPCLFHSLGKIEVSITVTFFLF